MVTTGTGSGKSLCFFVPIVDAIVQARKAGRPRKTRAIIVYPMNALANSQIKEIEKFISQSGLHEDQKPVVRRYTGQESKEERQRIAGDPPDILLTNFMMAELLLTRQDEMDTRVIDNANGLEFIVLDELHTLPRPPRRGCCDPCPATAEPLCARQGSGLYRNLGHHGQRRIGFGPGQSRRRCCFTPVRDHDRP